MPDKQDYFYQKMIINFLLKITNTDLDDLKTHLNLSNLELKGIQNKKQRDIQETEIVYEALKNKMSDYDVHGPVQKFFNPLYKRILNYIFLYPDNVIITGIAFVALVFILGFIHTSLELIEIIGRFMKAFKNLLNK